MKILIAEDDLVSRRLLEAKTRKWGYDPVACTDGEQALEVLLGEGAPRLCVLDWMMPGTDGVEVCRRLRYTGEGNRFYVILVTAKGRQEDIVAGLDAGADDYVVKPFNPAELHARLRVGERVIGLQSRLAERVRELEEALSQVRQLEELLPICSYCRRVRDDQNYWQQIEAYISHRSATRFSHGVCPDCYEKHVIPELEELDREP